MTSQEQLAKIGQAALDAKAEGLGLPPRLSTMIKQAEAEWLVLPTAPGNYVLVRDGAPARTAVLQPSGLWVLDGLGGGTYNKTNRAFREFLVANGRRPERFYTATEAQKLAADAVNLSRNKFARGETDAAWRRKGQLDIIGYIESIHRYRDLVNELVQATAPGGIIHVKVNG